MTQITQTDTDRYRQMTDKKNTHTPDDIDSRLARSGPLAYPTHQYQQ